MVTKYRERNDFSGVEDTVLVESDASSESDVNFEIDCNFHFLEVFNRALQRSLLLTNCVHCVHC
jgi:hypothetical protein